jgi:hydrogenase expression/formation protein HypE
MSELKQPQKFDAYSCPLPFPQNQKVVIGHGSGGKMTHELVRQIFHAHFKNDISYGMDDSAQFQAQKANYAITTDCHVVTPLFFPGGDIGRLAVCGTVNDLAMVGAVPRFITAGFILEEGLAFDVLNSVAASMQQAAEESGVQIIAGDTKVVQKGKADQLYITTSGFGIIPEGINIRGTLAQPGDQVILSGTIGDHGIAVLSARGELGVDVDITSDVAPVSTLANEITAVYKDIHALRDPTRGGLATTLNEIAEQSKVCIRISEDKIPIKMPVRAACELFGFNPLYIANEGKFIAIASASSTDSIVERMRRNPLGREAVVIGEVEAEPRGKVLLKTALGTTQVLDMLSGELLPRIC